MFFAFCSIFHLMLIIYHWQSTVTIGFKTQRTTKWGSQYLSDRRGYLSWFWYYGNSWCEFKTCNYQWEIINIKWKINKENAINIQLLEVGIILRGSIILRDWRDILAPLEWGTRKNLHSIERCLFCAVLL